MTKFEKELNEFLNNKLDFDNCYKTIDCGYYNLGKEFIGGFYEKLSIGQLLQLENFLKEKLNINKIYVEVCETDAGYAISWE